MNDRCRDGFRVVGDSIYGELHCWYFPTLELANAFAKHLCAATKKEVDVMKYVGSWKLSEPPTEFVAAKEATP